VAPVAQYGSLVQEPPTLTVESGDRKSLQIEVLEQKWNLFYPQEIQVVDSEGPLEPVSLLDQTGGTLGNFLSRLKFPSLQRFGVQLLMIGGAIVVFAFLSGRIRPSILMVTQFVLLLFISLVFVAFMLPAFKRERLELHSMKSTSAPMPASAEFSSSVGNLKFHAEGQAEERYDKEVLSDFDSAATKDADAVVDLGRDMMKRKRPQAPAMAQDAPAKAEDDGEFAPQRPLKGMNLEGGTNLTMDGLLSLQIGFEPPAGSREKVFYYFGADTSLGGIPLEVNYIDRYSRGRIRIFMMALFAVLGWFLRRVSLANKIKLATLGLFGPLIVAPLIPVTSQNLADGCFFGALAAIMIWLICSSIHCCAKWCCAAGRSTKPAGVVAGLALFFTTMGTADAQEGPAPPTVIVPFTNPSDPLASDRVFLSQEQFLELYRLANPGAGNKVPAPQSGGLIEALYAA
jgi:hypothetical protein